MIIEITLLKTVFFVLFAVEIFGVLWYGFLKNYWYNLWSDPWDLAQQLNNMLEVFLAFMLLIGFLLTILIYGGIYWW